MTEDDVRVVSDRMGAWSSALGGLAEPDACRRFLEVLERGDGAELRRIVDGWGFGPVECVDIVETITRFIHTGDYEGRRNCALVHKLRPLRPSGSSGMAYLMPDGTWLWLSEAEWWRRYGRAENDAAWREANSAMLEAIGVLTCTWRLERSVERVDLERHTMICGPAWGGGPREG